MYTGGVMLGPAIAGGTVGSLINLGGKLLEGEIQAGLQEDQQQFAKEQSQNQIKYNVQQMRELGFSPLMLFDHGNATGGGAGAGGQGSAPNINLGQQTLGLINAVGQILKEDAKNDVAERKVDLQEKKENRLEDREFYQKMQMHNRAEQYRTQSLLNNQLYEMRRKNYIAYNYKSPHLPKD